MKKLFALLLAAALLLTMAACGKDDQEPTVPTVPDGLEDILDPTEGQGEEENATVGKIGLSSEPFVIPDTADEQEGTVELTSRNCSQVAMNFVAAIAQNYYTSALAGFDVDGSPFMTAEDISYAVPRSDLSTIANYSGKEVYLFVDEDGTYSYDDSANVIVELRDTNDTVLTSYTIDLKLNKDNKWIIDDASFYEQDYYITVPGNTTLYINDTEVSKDLIDHKTGYSDRKDCYRIPVIGKNVKNLKVTCEAFEETVEAIPATNNSEEPFLINHNLTETELNDALNATKTLWTNLYNDYVGGVPETEWLKYFSVDAPATYVNEIKSSFGDLVGRNTDHRMTLIQKRSDSSCFYLTDKVIVMNIQYQMDYIEHAGTLEFNEATKPYSHILLTIEDGEYKIFEVSDMKLFREVGSNEW